MRTEYTRKRQYFWKPYSGALRHASGSQVGVQFNCFPLQLLPFMHSDNEDKKGSESSSSFRKSIQKFVYEEEVKTSPLRRSLRQQQRLGDVEPSTEADEQKLLDIPGRKRRPSQEICSSPELKESPSPSTSKRVIRSPKRKRGYAPPEAYAHLREINDCIKMHLDGKLLSLISILCTK